MGFYDQDRPTSRSNAQRQRSMWFTSFISAIIGGLIVMMLLPALAHTGLFPYEIAPQNSEAVSEERPAAGTERPPSEIRQTSVEVSSDVIDAVENVSKAIVGVVNIQEGQIDFFNRTVEDVEAGTGSGVIFDKTDGKALIVTNYHVIENAKEVEISLANGERVKAQLIGADPLTDLAVLSIDDEHVEAVAEFGDSDSLRPGEPAIAIGNPLGLEFSRTVTQGIISATERSVPVETEMGEWELNLIQTDAAINPGNSGGALINIDGKVIGIPSLKFAQTVQGSIEGMGFAIPVNDAIPVIEDLIANGEVKRPQMGIYFLDLTEIPSQHWQGTLNLPADIKQGVIIREVQPGGPADKAGLQALDVLVKIDGQEIANSMDLRKALYAKNIGDTIEVTFYRDGLPLTENVELSEPMPLPLE